jgi:hypothetical protein
MKGPEGRYIGNIDNNRDPKNPEQIYQTAMAAEGVFVDLINSIPGVEARLSTNEEDSGVKQIEQGSQLDAVVYQEESPILGVQITTARDRKVREEKLQQLKERPLVRLAEMKREDEGILRVLVNLDPDEVEMYLKDSDLDKHPKLAAQTYDSIIYSLRYHLLTNQDKRYQEKIQKLLDLFESKKKEAEMQ